VLTQIAEEIRSGYTLGYVPPATGDGYRAIRIDVRPADGRKLSVRARPGYTVGAATAEHDRY
jgi:hypothetical protein